MVPTLAPGDLVLVDPRAFRARPPVPGALVACDDPERPGRWLVKRVAGVGPGGFRLRTAGLSDAAEWPTVPLPTGTVYLLSDAPEGRDSRRFGPVPVSALRGAVWYRTAPRATRGPLPPPAARGS